MKKEQRTIICPHCGKPIELSDNETGQNRHSSAGRLVACIIVSVIVCAVAFGLYMHADSRRETEAWELAMQSDDAMTVKAYLDTYRQAPIEHRSKAGELLTRLEAEANDWHRVVASGLASEYMAYAKRHADSRFAPLAMEKADSLTYYEARTANTAERFEAYLDAFPNGRYAAEARAQMENLRLSTVRTEDQIAAEMVASSLIAAISSRDKESLMGLMADTLQLFMGDHRVPRSLTPRLIAAVSGPEGNTVNWMEPSNISVVPSTKGDGRTPVKGYIDLAFSSMRTHAEGGATQEKLYNFALTLNPQGRIVRLALSREN